MHLQVFAHCFLHSVAHVWTQAAAVVATVDSTVVAGRTVSVPRTRTSLGDISQHLFGANLRFWNTLLQASFASRVQTMFTSFFRAAITAAQQEIEARRLHIIVPTCYNLIAGVVGRAWDGAARIRHQPVAVAQQCGSTCRCDSRRAGPNTRPCHGHHTVNFASV